MIEGIITARTLDDPSSASLSFSSTRARTPSNMLNTPTPPRRLRSSTQISQDLSAISVDISFQRPNSLASCYQVSCPLVLKTLIKVTSINETAAKKVIKRNALRCISYTRDHVINIRSQLHIHLLANSDVSICQAL